MNNQRIKKALCIHPEGTGCVMHCGYLYNGKGGDPGKWNEKGIRKPENLKYGPQRHWYW
jgi:hypothetical protein